MPTKREVLDSLRKVIDPEIGLNIVDLGLVYRVEVSEETGSLDIDFTLTSPGCPLADVIENDMLRVLKDDHGLDAVNTNLVWSPPWNLDFMSEEARLELGYPI
ncbi:metal-sulfur cluster assembly factor [Spirochaeta lutea]|uniref:Aromatic ring hydroxylase n=1 Tax=Spirochaeta lutea TaxID=1480694 RepID=A0A098QT22_9SPIO|nr:metal-sulfur cluster assembly factor [Spirochaeta lutea]KGE70716.1 aromatic ring hydroxylase [Spirochaeta lutea]